MQILRYGLIAALAFASGLAIGNYYTKKKLEEEYQNDTEEYREYIINKYNLLEEKENNDISTDAENIEETETQEDAPLVESKVAAERTAYKRIITNYNKPDLATLAKKYEEANVEEIDEDYEAEPIEDEEEDDNGEAESERMSAINNEEPYLITRHDFYEENEHYDKISLYYYRNDDTVCDDKDKKMEDVEEEIGWDFYKALERQTVAYVRNEVLRTDFEIYAIARSYESDVNQRIETDREKHYRQISRRKEMLDDEEI